MDVKIIKAEKLVKLVNEQPKVDDVQKRLDEENAKKNKSKPPKKGSNKLTKSNLDNLMADPAYREQIKKRGMGIMAAAAQESGKGTNRSGASKKNQKSGNSLAMNEEYGEGKFNIKKNMKA